jgi:hypothetical protein
MRPDRKLFGNRQQKYTTEPLAGIAEVFPINISKKSGKY